MRVEIEEGSQAGAATVTDAVGRFEVPGPFSGAVTVRASREGYRAVTRRIDGAPYSIGLRLEPDGPSVDISGEYGLTLIADQTCTSLPDSARQRTYALTIRPDPASSSPLLYQGTLSGARFRGTPEVHAEIGVSGTVARLRLGTYGAGLVESIDAGALHIWGFLDAHVDGPGSSGAFVGAFEYCHVSQGGPGILHSSCDVPPAYCESASHAFRLVKR